MYKLFFKRIFDFALASAGFIILLPVVILTTIFLFFANKGNVFFLQPRPGLNRKVFKIIKFKTMNDRRGANGELLPDSKRLTPVGLFIRKTSLDEIPQLLNVIKGEMSLIGPRPLLPEYLELYSTEQNRRHDVKPGITGWAQVNGRNAISWKEKFKLDVWYVDRISFVLDLKIIWMTFLKVFKSEGINAKNQATMTKFDGN